MTEPNVRVVRASDVEAFELGGGSRLRLLDGAQYGFGNVSLVLSEYPSGSGADLEHRHPHVSSIVVVGGKGRFKVGDDAIVAEAGDIVVVPADAWHSFHNIGDEPLRIVGVHDSSQHAMEFPD
jgi:mannose-6-phosphate isomerase-like protein (cupin superfamily)